MVELIKKIQSLIGNNFIVVGSVSMRYHGLEPKSRKKSELDVVVNNNLYFDKLSILGEYEININGERTPFKEEKRMFIRTAEGSFIDIYLDTTPIEFDEINVEGTQIKIRSKSSYLEHYSSILKNYDFIKYDTQGQFKEKVLKYIDLLS